MCSGERMEGLIHKLYPGIVTTPFRPEHEQNRLGNDFRCYADFDSELFLGPQGKEGHGDGVCLLNKASPVDLIASDYE